MLVNPLTQQTPSPPNPPPPLPKNKSPLILIIIIAVIVLIGLGILGSRALNKPSTKSLSSHKTPPGQKTITPTPSLQPKPTQKTVTTTPSATTSASPVGYVIKDTLCYALTIPKDNDAGNENSCDLEYRAYIETPTEKRLFVGSQISPEWKDYKGLLDMANYWKIKIKSADDKIILEGAIKVGNLDAYEILAKNDISRLESSHVFVYIPDKYNSKGLPVNGFTILTTYSATDKPDLIEAQKKEQQRLLTSWKWK